MQFSKFINVVLLACFSATVLAVPHPNADTNVLQRRDCSSCIGFCQASCYGVYLGGPAAITCTQNCIKQQCPGC
ncbi:hypothetical protein BT63DRAFT_450422 [Microthyrium microscopicum]|uniref:Uncharacterized protein n=1 Tax=Microthyrium microscopicum TaxID=703497 RepID=A0A6A6UUJ1_9PEZI|nr:hypothetical protein BT63DRAFT_450422 [Microthyrium microscopicum]